MKILVIGGSYFFGRWFVQMAYKDHEVTVLNRGNIKVGMDKVTELIADRHDEDALNKLASKDYDCIVDFCGYKKGDISTIIKYFGAKKARYIFVSTVDVYKKGTGALLNENSPLAASNIPEDVTGYISGKLDLEAELIAECKKAEMSYCSIRPAILYGPANYAPRESMYFDWITNSAQIINPMNANGYFQFIYVVDAAKALLKICELDVKKLEHAYNFCTSTISSYSDFNASLHAAIEKEFTEITLDIDYILENEIPLPFPLFESESEKYDWALYEELGVPATNLVDGLRTTYHGIYG